jgi:hypothetical protein
MSTRRPDLKSRMTVAATRRAEPDAPAAGVTSIRTAPARITLNLPPALYRELLRWADGAAETIDVPRVGVQDALRAMIRVMTDGSAPNTTARIIAQLREER